MDALVLVGALTFSAVPQAQTCGADVLLKRLDAGLAGPELRTPGGAPVVGGSFEFRVEGAQPSTVGAMVFSPVVSPSFSPDYGAVFWFGVPYGTQFFATDSEGRSPALFGVGEVDPFLCGEPGVFQAGVFDPAATGGVAVTNAIWLRVGVERRPLFPGVRGLESRAVGLDVGDVDGDGILDLVAVRDTNNRLYVVLGTGNGVFADVATDYVVQDDPQSVRLADLDGDGDLDAVTANIGTAPSRCCSGTETGPSPRRRTSQSASGPRRSPWPMGTKTPCPTSGRRTWARTTCRCCSGTATAPSRRP